MTAQEAIQFLKETIAGCTFTKDKQLKEVCEVSIEALEKQIPQKPIIKTHKYIGSDDDFVDEYFCPVCKTLIINKDTNGFYAGRKQKHCDCGQALDWSDTE